jgi:hypothetical protein
MSKMSESFIGEYQFMATFFIKYNFWLLQFWNRVITKMVSNFWQHLLSQHYSYQKKHVATFGFLVKMNLVSTVVHINSTTLIWLLTVTKCKNLTPNYIAVNEFSNQWTLNGETWHFTRYSQTMPGQEIVSSF